MDLQTSGRPAPVPPPASGSRFTALRGWRLPVIGGAVVLTGVAATVIATQLGSRPASVVLDPSPTATVGAGAADVAPPDGTATTSPAAASGTSAAPAPAAAVTTTTAGQPASGSAPAGQTAATVGSVVTETTSTGDRNVVTVVQSGRAVATGDTTGTTVAEPYYADCAAATSAGAGPVVVGSPGYRPELDPDGDGVACM